ncbi:MAG TPA: hypothetical protein VF710_14620 [Longimicrobium sp.]|jgi:hypothetical protein
MKEMKVRELIPPMWPPDSFTIEEALKAWDEVHAENEARRNAPRKRPRAASKKVVPTRGDGP